MWECNWWELYRTDALVNSYLRANFPYKRPLSEKQLSQCDVEVPEHLRDYISNFSPFFKNTVVIRVDIGDFMKDYAEKDGIMSQPRIVLITSLIVVINLLSSFFHNE